MILQERYGRAQNSQDVFLMVLSPSCSHPRSIEGELFPGIVPSVAVVGVSSGVRSGLLGMHLWKRWVGEQSRAGCPGGRVPGVSERLSLLGMPRWKSLQGSCRGCDRASREAILIQEGNAEMGDDRSLYKRVLQRWKLSLVQEGQCRDEDTGYS